VDQVSAPDDIDVNETQLRNSVAICTRTLNHLDILGYSGHVSVQLPDSDHFLIQAFDQSRSTVAPDDLIVVDAEGEPVRGPEGYHPPNEVFIHTEIYKARADVKAVFHFHPDVATLFTLVDGITLKPMKNHAIRWASGIPVHPVPAKIIDPEMGAALAETLANHNGALMRAHGAVIVAESIEALMIDAIHFVENAETMYKAAMLGPVKALSQAEMQEIEAKTSRPNHIAKLWDYYTGNAVAADVFPTDWL
jgi:L-ribulose-5-phosphate 4-epimerase